MLDIKNVYYILVGFVACGNHITMYIRIRVFEDLDWI